MQDGSTFFTVFPRLRAALTQVDDEDEAAAALALARRKLAATRGLDPDVRRRRALALLGRKGYSAPAAADAVDAAWAEVEGA